ncbi:MAG: hypothetical protein AAFU49_21905 [Pseudomonadota bacterium]|jgi:putative transposase
MTPFVPPHAVSIVAMFRFAVLSQVETRVSAGQARPEAIRQVAALPHLGPDHRRRNVSRRSIYRWARAYRVHGLPGLEPVSRTSVSASRVLDAALLDFLATQKEQDPRASVPELIARAVQAGLLHRAGQVDRTTVWRALGRLGVSTRRARKPPKDTRRFEMPHRLQLVLCDGKHFRAGASRTKRVALFFLDDATRYVPHVVVGPSESTVLFLRGLLGLLRTVGKVDAVYFDNGSGFSAHDSHEVLANLGIPFIHGTAGYPAARGKVERFNRTADSDFLRTLCRPEVDPDCTSLEVQISQYLRQTYHPRGHAGLSGVSPLRRYLDDERPLRLYEDPTALRAKFVASEERLVSADHVIRFAGAEYEVPRGLAGQRVKLVRDAFEPTNLRLEHEGRWVRLAVVDRHANARAARGTAAEPSNDDNASSPLTAAAHNVDTAMAPITQPDGGYADPKES